MSGRLRGRDKKYNVDSTSNPQSQAPRPERKITRLNISSSIIATHHPSLPPPFPLNRQISDIDSSHIMKIIDELPESTQLLDAFNVLRENSRVRDRWEARVQQWRKCRPVTTQFIFSLIDLPYLDTKHKCFKPSTPTNAIRAAVTYNNLRLEASELRRLDIGVEAAKKTLDYLLLCSFQDNHYPHGLEKELPEHERWFSEAIKQINPSINPDGNPPNETLNNSLQDPTAEAGRATDPEIEEAGGRAWLESEFAILRTGQYQGLPKPPSHIPT